MNIESSHKLTSSGDTASGCIEGVNMEDYQVGVVGGRKISPVTETKVPSQCTNLCWIIVAIAIVLAVSAVAIVITIFICIKQRQRRKQNTLLHKSKDVESPGESPPARYVPLPKHPKETTPLIKSAEDIYSLLLPVASKWQTLGKALSLDKDRLDEISTNNETDEACLRVMLELYTKRPGWSREEIDEARKKVEAPPLSETGTTTEHIAIDMENSEAISDKPMETSGVESTTETGANGTCEEQSIDSRLSFEVVESHQSGDLDETILTSSEDKASMAVSPASTTLQTKDMREQIVRIVTSTPKGSTTESRNLEKSPPPPTFSLSESIDEIEKATAANATPIQVQQQKISDEIIVVHGKQELQVARVHRRLSKTFIEAHENREEEADDRAEEITTTPSVEDKSKEETSKFVDSAYMSADLSTLDDREISVETEDTMDGETDNGETEDTAADDLTRRKERVKAMNEQLVCPTNLSSKASADQFTAKNPQLKNGLTSWTPECVGDSTSLYPPSYWPPQQQPSDGDSIVKVTQEDEGPT